MASKKALLAGINTYESASDLRGCISDVEKFQSLLTDVFEFPQNNIHAFVNGDVVKDKVEAEWKWLLKGAKPGDSVVVMFAGHGSIRADLDDDEAGGVDEVLCMYDMDFEDPNSYLRTDELHQFTRQLPDGVALTIIFDCCHVGPSTRLPVAQTGKSSLPHSKVPLIDQATTAARALDETAPHQPLGQSGAIDSSQFVLARFVEPNPKVLDLMYQNGIRNTFLRPRREQQPNHFVVSASRPEQIAADAFMDGGYHGAFSFYFCQAARSAGPGADGLSVFNEVRGLLSRAKFSQDPQLELRMAAGPLFGGKSSAAEDKGTVYGSQKDHDIDALPPPSGTIDDDDGNVDLDARPPHTEGGSGGPGWLLSLSSPPGTVYPVWFGTNRKPARDPGQGFLTARCDETTLGRVDVFIPEAHRFAELGTGWWTRLKRFDLRDDHLRIQRIHRRDATTFWYELQHEMRRAQSEGDPRHALVFIHGFNVDFAEAAIRAAQIGFDLDVPGATAMFSWPSRGTLQDYPADEATIEASEGAITKFLIDFATKSGADKVHLIAHSMGNRGLLRALQRIAGNVQSESPIRFGQIFLAAPDVDRDVFLELAHLYPQFSERTTLYSSNGDLPVRISSYFHGAPRAGYFLPYTIANGIDTIAVPDFDLDLLGHSYFVQAEAIMNDMHRLMSRDEPPDRRGPRIRPAVHGRLKFWELRR